MKSICKFLISFLMIFTLMNITQTTTVKAENININYGGGYDYSISCGYSYSVDVVNDRGTFDNKGCYADFNAAKSAMKTLGNDAVVRHVSSLSPTKIIAMNSGIAYTYPYRSGSNTVSFYDYDTNVSSYTNQHVEMNYIDTILYDGSGNGTVRANVTGFDGKIKLKNVDLVPMKFLKTDLCIYLGGNDITSQNEQAFLVNTKHSYYSVVQNGNYKEVHLTAYSGYNINGKTPVIYVNNMAIGLAADWMTTGSTYYSPDGVSFYSDMEYFNLVGTYYNYYQFLPLRSKTSLTAENFKNYLANIGYTGSAYYNLCSNFIDAQNAYGINALLLFAQANLESAYGTSNYALNRNNIFGVNAVDSNPDNASFYPSIAASINQQANNLLYAYCKAYSDVYYGGFYGNKGAGITTMYASDPYYGFKIANVAYSIDKYSNGYNGNLTDYGRVSYGVANNNINIYSSTNESSILYNSTYGNGYQEYSTIIVLDQVGDYYKVQSTNYLANTSNYNWDTYIGYVRKNDLTILYGDFSNKNETTDENIMPDDAVVYSSLDNITWLDDTKVQLSGMGFISGMNATNDVYHELILTNMETNEETIYEATTSNPNFTPIYDCKDYSNIMWTSEFDTNDLTEGNYSLKVRIHNGEYVQDRNLYSLSSDVEHIFKKEDVITKFFADSVYNFRVELSIEKQNINMSVINKPSMKTSMFDYNSINLNDGKLNISGIAMISNMNTTSNENPKYSLLLESENGDIYSYDLNVKQSPMDYGSILQTKYSMNYCDFNESLNLTDLPSGSYRVYLDLTSGDYRDIFEMYYITNNKIDSVEFEGRTYNLKTTAVRSRYILTIE